MIPETSVNWKAFEYIYSDNPQRAFENLTYYLFCHEFNQKNGIFRYFNQPHIETNPIRLDDKIIGFQSKYYADSVTMSSKESELIEAVKGAAKAYSGITTLYFYISHEFSPSSKKDIVKPSYQVSIENVAQNLGIEIEWRGISNIEAQLMQDSQLTVCRNVFFQVDSAVQKCCESLDRHKNDIFDRISTNVMYKGNKIVLDHNALNLDIFLNSSDQILIVYGDAGSGKSALIKQAVTHLSDGTAFLAFKSTDMDVDDKLKFLNLHGTLVIDEVLDVYKEADNRILYIDAVEKYFVLEYQQTFEDILQVFMNAGWKLVLTIRTAYKESFHNLLLNEAKVQQYHVDSLSYDKLSELSITYGFRIPRDKKLTDILCAPFYLGLYLALDNLEDEEMLALNREAFEKKIWEDIIRNNRKRKNNMPTRREDALTSITREMLQSESYLYVIQATDDHEALSELEQSGVLTQTDDARKYCHSHDVFEELVVSHIFMEQYKNNIEGNQFFAQFRTSLRIRKLFRGWLSDFASIKGHEDIIFRILDGKDVNRIWKDEVLLTIISTENLKDVYCKIATNMADNNCEMLKKIAFLINTCCRVADHTDIYLNRGNLLPFRLSKPSGYAWETLFEFIADNKESIYWDKKLVSVIIDVLDSWTKYSENAKTENTRIAGEIGLFLLKKISDDEDLRYSVRDEQVKKLQEVLLNSAWMIRDHLSNIFQIVIDGINDGEKDISFPFTMKNNRPNAPRMYVDLAERAVSDIYHYGNVPYAMPEMVIRLMKKLWLRPVGIPIYDSLDMDGYFGINSHLSNNYHPASAYKTPILNMLQGNQKLSTDFLISFFNATGDAYVNSHLNADYSECLKVIIHVENQKIEQVASDRLWKMYRGTHVGPDILVSLLMGFETWLFSVVKNSAASVVTDYCRYVLKGSQNVMLTSIIVSIAEAYPEKMFDVVCDLLKTKEIFHLDSDRLASEWSASFLLFGNNLFEKERLESNKLPHRRKRLEDVILGYQTNTNGIPEEDFNLQRQRVYSAIDDATVNIDTWLTPDKYAYYRMDLRHYQEVVDVNSDGEGHEIYTVIPDFTEDMKKLSKQSQEAYDSHLKYMDLQLWSDYKFSGNEKFKEYDKYTDVTIVCKELRELGEYLRNFNDEDNIEQSNRSLIIHRYVSIASYTSAVLLRDYNKDLIDKDRELCEIIIFAFGYMFTQASDFEIVQAGNGIEAVIVGLILILDEDNRKIIGNENPLYLLLKLVLRDWSDDSRITKQIADTIWKYSKGDGWRFIYIFSLIADQYEKEIMKNMRLSIDDFFENHQKIIAKALKKDIVDVTDIDFTKLSNVVTFTIIAFVSTNMKEAFVIAEMTKDITMKIAFGNKNSIKEERREIIGYTLNYVIWFADVLLHCEDVDRKILIDSFVGRADIIGNENVEHLFTWLINDQEVYGKIDEFWSVWELLKPRIIALNNEKERFYYSSYNGPFGKDRIIAGYLFANSAWRENVHRCALLSEERAVFFDDFIAKSESIKAMFYALAKLLNTVGMDPYKEIGIEWIYKLVQKDPECKVTLYDNTLFYLEEYIGSFTARHRTEFRMDVKLAQKTQIILEYLVTQGSQIAFFVREQI